VLAAVVLAACAAPSRRLTPRVVEDGIVLPRRMASVGLGGSVSQYEPSGTRSFDEEARFRFGITDRLEWADLLTLRYALLDDRPADSRPPAPLSLAVQAGTRGIGWSSTTGMIAMPIVSVQVRKHVGDRWAFGGSASWLAIWHQKPAAFMYTMDLDYTPGRRSFWLAGGYVTRQLGERFALSFSAWFTDAAACISPTCNWITRGTGGALSLVFRPWHWLTVGAGPYAGLRYRPNTIPPSNPADPVPTPPEMVEWFGASAGATFYW
jgi:hypothetical protein